MNIKADINPSHKKKNIIVTVSAPHMAHDMPIHMVKIALYLQHIQLGEEIIKIMWVTYTTKVFKEMITLLFFIIRIVQFCNDIEHWNRTDFVLKVL